MAHIQNDDKQNGLELDSIRIVRSPYIYNPFVEGEIRTFVKDKIPEGISPEMWYRKITASDVADYMGQLDQENQRLSELDGSKYKRVEIFEAIYYNRPMPEHRKGWIRNSEGRLTRTNGLLYRDRFEREFSSKWEYESRLPKYKEGRLEVKDMFHVSIGEGENADYIVTPTLDRLHEYLEWTKNLNIPGGVCNKLKRYLDKHGDRQWKRHYLDHDNLPFPNFAHNPPRLLE